MKNKGFLMANKKASKKSAVQSEAQRLINKSKMSRIKTEKKKFLEIVSSNSASSENVATQFSKTQSLIAKAAKTNLMHWKKAARLVSRMADKIKAQ